MNANARPEAGRGGEVAQPLLVQSPIPLYYQLAGIFRDKIRQGEWAPGSTIPPETELQETYRVSRATVRQALELLVREDLVERRRGRGTQVRPPRITRELPGLTSFSEEMEAAGYRPGSTTLIFEVRRQPEPSVVEALGLKPGEEVVYLERLRRADHEVLGVSRSYLPGWVWQRLAITPADLDDRSLYAYLEQRAGIELAEADEVVRVHPADPALARLIRVRAGFPVVELERVVYTHSRIPVEYGFNIFRADKYQIRVHHRRVRHAHGHSHNQRQQEGGGSR